MFFAMVATVTSLLNLIWCSAAVYILSSTTAHAGDRSFESRKAIGEVHCCESWMDPPIEKSLEAVQCCCSCYCHCRCNAIALIVGVVGVVVVVVQ